MAQYKYILNPAAPSVTVWIAPPPYERKDKGAFRINADLTAKDLEHLYNQGYTQYVSRFTIPSPVQVIEKKTKTEKKG